MTNIDFAALKAQLEHHAQSARQIPSEPLFSIRPDVLRAIIVMAEERDAVVADRDALKRDVAMIREAALREAKEAVNKVLLDTDRPVHATIAWAAIDILSE